MAVTPPDEVEAIIRRVAGQYQFPSPELLVATAKAESSLNPYAVGDSGNSRGIFQENVRGRGAGLRPEQSFDPVASTERAIREFNAIRVRFPDVDPGTWAARAQRPADPLGYAQKVNQLLGGGAPPSGAEPAPTAAPDWYRHYQQQAPERAPPAPPPAAASESSPAWYRQFLQGGGTAPAAPPGGTPAATARPPATGPSEPGAAPGKQPGWLELASSQLGKPYIWGSAGGRSNFSLDAPGYDCSGFVAQVYKNAFGVAIPAFTGSAYPATKPVAAQEAQPGDLVFWNMSTPDPRRQHVAIYIGDGKVIQSGGQGDGVNIAPVTQMPGAEFRRSPAAYANYSAAPDPQRVSPGSPDRPGAVWLQGTVARTPGAAEAATATSGGPDWYRQYLAGAPRAQGGS